MSNHRRVGAILSFAAAMACSDPGTGPDTKTGPENNVAPRVTIESIAQQGSAATVTYAFSDGNRAPEHQVASGSLTFDGSRRSLQVQGSSGRGSEQIGPITGTHSVQIEVCDGPGLCARADSSFASTQAPANYAAQLLLFDGERTRHLPNVEFCLDNICGMSDAQGQVRLENIGLSSRVVGDIDGLQQSHIAGLPKQRTGKNVFGLTPYGAQLGRVARDASIGPGENVRRIVYFPADFPLDEMSERWFQPFSQDTALMPDESPHRFAYAGDTLYVQFLGAETSVPEARRVYMAEEIQRIVGIVNEQVYKHIDFEETQLYEFRRLPNKLSNVDASPGLIRIEPTWDTFTWELEAPLEGEDGMYQGAIIRTVHQGWSEQLLRWSVASATFMTLCGIDEYSRGTGLTAFPAAPQEPTLEPTPEELVMCRTNVMHGPAALMRPR